VRDKLVTTRLKNLAIMESLRDVDIMTIFDGEKAGEMATLKNGK